MIEKLYHVWMEPIEKFFRRIDDLGGWPLGKTYVVMHHSLMKNRQCKFMNAKMSTEWWTTICHADRYYEWKLSPLGLDKIRQDGTKGLKKRIRKVMNELL